MVSNLGLAELGAHDENAFVRIAANLARDPVRLRGLRSELRGRMERSPLMGAERFARNVETAYRRMWRRWCGPRPVPPPGDHSGDFGHLPMS